MVYQPENSENADVVAQLNAEQLETRNEERIAINAKSPKKQSEVCLMF